jgi:hypothetical protein
MQLKSILKKSYNILATQCGIDPHRFIRFLFGLPFYLRDWFTFRIGFSGVMSFVPCLHDRYGEGGETKSEYFWQDLLVARAVYAANPVKHVDIGSRIDGFVAHVASFREIEVFDVRSISTKIPGVVFHQADLMDAASLPKNAVGGYCDSLSCLHAIEHFGLGRYGDPVNPIGYQSGIVNMVQLLKSGGTFYLSTPIGRERVEFNANWVFDPRSILRFAESKGLILKKLIVITPENGSQEIKINTASIECLALSNYQLGLFIFKKN